MKLEQVAESVEKLTVLLSHDKQNVTSATLRIAWGKLLLSAPVQVQLNP